MSGLRQFEYFLLRYVPDALKGEAVNVGVVLTGKDEAGHPLLQVRFVRDLRRVPFRDPETERELLLGIRRELEAGADREWLAHRVRETFSSALEATATKGVLGDDAETEIERLSEIYLVARRDVERMPSARQRIYSAMRGEFEREGVWDFLMQGISVEEFTHPGDPLKIDCAYRFEESTVRMFHAVALGADVNAVKVLGYSFPRIVAGVRRKYDRVPQLTAVVDDASEDVDPQVGFAREFLLEQGVEIAALAEMPRIAQRARVELGI